MLLFMPQAKPLSYFPIHPRAAWTPVLDDFRTRFQKNLFDQYFPFWDRCGVDHEQGGFYCWLNEDGERVSDSKYMWYQGRGLWVYSHAYRAFGENPDFLEIARKTYSFLLKHGREEDGYWRSSVGPRGEPMEGRDEMGYAGVFVAEGMQEYAHATGDSEAMKNALEAFERTVSLFNNPERSATEEYLPRYYPGIRLMGHEMVRIRFLRQVLEQQDRPEFRQALETAVDHVFNDFFLPDHGLTLEGLDYDYRALFDENRSFCLLGHSMEAFWMILDAGLFLGRQDWVDRAIERFWSHHRASWDAQAEMYRTVLDLDRGPHSGQVIWHFDESILMFLMIYVTTGSPWALSWAKKIEARAEELFRTEGKQGAIWARDTDDEGTIIRPIKRIGNYHTSRRWMLCLELLERLSQAND